MLSILQKLRSWLLGGRFGPMTALVVALFLIKEQFPFSNFPMYSNFDTEADVIYIADQSGQPLSMDKVFRSGSSTAKKAYKKELGKLTSKQGRDSNDATPAERAEAGKIVLGDWAAKRKPNALDASTKALRIYRRTFQLTGDKLSDQTPELLAEQAL